uniref:Uncharacterized protein n=1 Tax=Megaselia scalaris TaxID=36166 RepID=T1GPA2_MEGSC
MGWEVLANIQCKSLESSESGVKSNLPNGHINFQLPQPGGNLGFSEIQSQQAHLWKFIPPIELTVLE